MDGIASKTFSGTVAGQDALEQARAWVVAQAASLQVNRRAGSINRANAAIDEAKGTSEVQNVAAREWRVTVFVDGGDFRRLLVVTDRERRTLFDTQGRRRAGDDDVPQVTFDGRVAKQMRAWVTNCDTAEYLPDLKNAVRAHYLNPPPGNRPLAGFPFDVSVTHRCLGNREIVLTCEIVPVQGGSSPSDVILNMVGSREARGRATSVHPLPGASTLGRGFDYLGTNDARALRAPLFDTELTGTQVVIRDHTFDTSPVVAVDQTSTTETESHYFRSRHEYQNHLAAKAGIEGSQGAFSGAFRTSFAGDTNFDERRCFASYEVYITKYSLSLKGGFEAQLADWVKEDPTYANLPTTYSDDNKTRFFDFFQRYGTHYVTDVKVGGRLLYNATLDSSNVRNENEVKAEIEAEYHAVVSVEAEAKAEWSRVDEHWLKNRQLKVSTLGGNSRMSELSVVRNEGHAEAFQSWNESLDDSPAVISYGLAPVSHLFSGPARSAMDQALDSYRNSVVSVQSGAGGGIRGPQGVIEPPSIPPANTDEHKEPYHVVHVVLFDRETLTPSFNKAYAPSRSWFELRPPTDPATLEAQREFWETIYRDVAPFESENCVVLVNVTRGIDWAYPHGSFHDFLIRCGAGDTIDEWHRDFAGRSGGLPLQEITYCFLGLTNSEPRAALEGFSHGGYRDGEHYGADYVAVSAFLLPYAHDRRRQLSRLLQV